MKKKFNFAKKSTWKKILAVTLAAFAAIASIAGVVKLSKKLKEESKELSSSTFSVGGLNALGEAVDSDATIFTKKLFECQGLKIKPEANCAVQYQVFLYDSTEKFLEKTSLLSGEYEENNEFAKYARIVITPKDDKDGKISFWEVYDYADDLSISVNRKQGAVWTMVNVPTNVTQRVRDVAYSDGAYITVGTEGEVVYSSDMKKWTVSAIDNESTFTNIYMKDSTAYIVSFEKGIYKMDSLNSPAVLVCAEPGLAMIMEAEDKLIAVGNAGRLLTSTDGKVWTKHDTMPTTANINCIDYFNDLYVIATEAGEVFGSYDLVEWFNYTPEGMGDIRALCNYGGKIFVGGQDGKIYCASSLGVWLEAEVNSNLDLRYVRDIVEHNGKLYAVGYTEGGTGFVFESADGGTTWNVALQVAERLWSCDIVDDALFVTGDRTAIYYMK